MSHKVLLFSTRSYDEGGLFSSESTDRLISIDQDSPYLQFFLKSATSEEEKKLDYLRVETSRPKWEKIMSYLKGKGLWDEKPEDELFRELIRNNPGLKADKEFKQLHAEYREERKALNGASPSWDFSKIVDDDGISLNIDASNKPSTCLKNRFSFFQLKGTNNKGDGKNDVSVYMVWPLGRPAPIKDGQSPWIDALLSQIKLYIGDYEKAYLLLHDKDLFNDGQPFTVLKDFDKDNLKVAIFQHSPGDPIKSLLNKQGQRPQDIYDVIEGLIESAPKMIKFNEDNETNKVYLQITKSLPEAKLL